MKQLILLRHAKTRDVFEYPSDLERELTDKGEACAQAMGKLLKEKGYVPEYAASSHAVRAKQTLGLVNEGLGLGELGEESVIYTGQASDLVDLLKNQDDARNVVMFVGHNPSMEQCTAMLVGDRVGMKTCEAAVIEFAVGSWSECEVGGGKLLEYIEKPSV